MNMKFLSVVTPPPDIYHNLSNQKTLWEEKLKPSNTGSFGICDVRKYREIKNGEQCIILDIYSKLGCLENSKVTSSESKVYAGIPGKGLTNSLYIITKSVNKKQKARFDITYITNQDFRNLLNKFKDSTDLD